jgi:hypothetical protein
MTRKSAWLSRGILEAMWDMAVGGLAGISGMLGARLKELREDFIDPVKIFSGVLKLFSESFVFFQDAKPLGLKVFGLDGEIVSGLSSPFHLHLRVVKAEAEVDDFLLEIRGVVPAHLEMAFRKAAWFSAMTSWCSLLSVSIGAPSGSHPFNTR